MASGSKKVIYAALAGNALIAVSKFAGAIFTGSSAMLSEGVHSLVDTGNQVLMLHGLNRSKKGPDKLHPFGYGMEVYFWSFMVAILIFALGAGISFYEGLHAVQKPSPIGDPTWNYVILGLSMLFEGWAWSVAYREFRKSIGDSSLWAAIKRSKDPTIFTVLLEDTAAMLGLLIAIVSIFLAQILQMPILDGVASLLIGCLLAAVAIILSIECKGLLIGESASPEIIEGIESKIGMNKGIIAINEVLTMHMGPEDILLNLSVDFSDNLSAADVEKSISALEKEIKSEYPEIKRIFIEAQSVRGHRNSKL
ncbi:MAG: cation transporter [Sneathiella sp.]|nr:cation transporter [Sneathiella sp.]